MGQTRRLWGVPQELMAQVKIQTHCQNPHHSPPLSLFTDLQQLCISGLDAYFLVSRLLKSIYTGNYLITAGRHGGRRSANNTAKTSGPKAASGRGGNVRSNGAKFSGQWIPEDQYEAQLSAEEYNRYVQPTATHGFASVPPSKILRAKGSRSGARGPQRSGGGRRSASRNSAGKGPADGGMLGLGISGGGIGFSIAGTSLK